MSPAVALTAAIGVIAFALIVAVAWLGWTIWAADRPAGEIDTMRRRR